MSEKLREALERLDDEVRSMVIDANDPLDSAICEVLAAGKDHLAREQDAGEVVTVRNGTIYFMGADRNSVRSVARDTPDGFYRLTPVDPPTGETGEAHEGAVRDALRWAIQALETKERVLATCNRIMDEERDFEHDRAPDPFELDGYTPEDARTEGEATGRAQLAYELLEMIPPPPMPDEIPGVVATLRALSTVRAEIGEVVITSLGDGAEYHITATNEDEAARIHAAFEAMLASGLIVSVLAAPGSPTVETTDE